MVEHGGVGAMVAFFLGDANDEILEIFVPERTVGLELGLFFVNAIKHPVVFLLSVDFALSLAHALGRGEG